MERPILLSQARHIFPHPSPQPGTPEPPYQDSRLYAHKSPPKAVTQPSCRVSTMSTEENTAQLQRLADEVLTGHNLAALLWPGIA